LDREHRLRAVLETAAANTTTPQFGANSAYGNEAYGSDSDLNKKPIFAIDEMREASSDSDDDDTLNVRVMRKNACVPPHNVSFSF
uniref:Di19_C domain-containing protein n=1 Tax=Anisakis simplex TaxID=6269 RepID=A0A0M3JFM1_ANISI